MGFIAPIIMGFIAPIIGFMPIIGIMVGIMFGIMYGIGIMAGVIGRSGGSGWLGPTRRAPALAVIYSP
ncbi:hypothetical protein, partial [Serratia marcescens]|uniref:hypothetical protein n=1 Tax=Serratia marcescens TaxID=615 RepID=UPI0013DB3DB4